MSWFHVREGDDGMYDLVRMPGHRVPEAFGDDRLALLPLGSLEWHGPHGPLGTDTLVAAGLAREIAEQTGAILLPPIIYTPCPPRTARYPGTFHVSEPVADAYVVDVCEAAIRNGIRQILFLIAHDAAIDLARRVAERLEARHANLFLAAAPWWQSVPVSAGAEAGFTEHGGHGHGGPLEIAAAMAYAPESAALDHGQPIDLGERVDAVGVEVLTDADHSAAWKGYHGRVAEASVERGRAVLDVALRELVAFVRSRKEQAVAPPEGGWLPPG